MGTDGGTLLIDHAFRDTHSYDNSDHPSGWIDHLDSYIYYFLYWGEAPKSEFVAGQ